MKSKRGDYLNRPSPRGNASSCFLDYCRFPAFSSSTKTSTQLQWYHYPRGVSSGISAIWRIYFFYPSLFLGIIYLVNKSIELFVHELVCVYILTIIFHSCLKDRDCSLRFCDKKYKIVKIGFGKTVRSLDFEENGFVNERLSFC